MTPTTFKPASLLRRGPVLAAGVALFGAGVLFAGTWGSATAEDAKAGDTEAAKIFDDKQRAGIEAIVRDYLLKNPELLIEVQTALNEKMEKIQAAEMKAAIKSNAGELYRREDAPSAGAEKGDITVVEFFDYNCGYCKRGFSEVAKLIEQDNNVRVVFKELPILSQGSEEASKVALAAKQQGKYWEMHQALLNYRGSVNKDVSLKIAKKIGLDVGKLEKDMESDAVKQEIDKVRQLAQKMGINGTPHFLVGDRTIPGAPENLYEQLASHIKELRKDGCEVC